MQDKVKVKVFYKSIIFNIENVNTTFYKSKALYFLDFRKSRKMGIWFLKKRISLLYRKKD